MPITEQPLPPIAADEREPVLIAFDSTGSESSERYANRLYEYAHLAAQGKTALGSRTRMIPEPDGSTKILVLLPFPLQAACIKGLHTFRFSAAILSQHKNGAVEGWLVNRHDVALSTWRTMHPDSLA